VLLVEGKKLSWHYPSEDKARLARSWVARALETMARHEREAVAHGS
jgi:hypothetical protein